MGRLQFSSILLACAVLHSALGRANNAANNLGITGGHKIQIRDAPYMAGLTGKDGMCGGSIVHERFILTSAYCALFGQALERAHVGSNHVNSGGTYLEIEEKLCHVDYNINTFENDICLLKLREPVAFSKRVAKVDLVEADVEIAEGTMVNVTGWGSKSAGDHVARYPKFLQQATISVFSDHACLQFEPNMSDTMLCAGWQGRDACEGDAGGPLTLNNVQVGIVSFGPPRCGQQPSFYTKVSKFVTWIRSTIEINS